MDLIVVPTCEVVIMADTCIWTREQSSPDAQPTTDGACHRILALDLDDVPARSDAAWTRVHAGSLLTRETACSALGPMATTKR